MSDQFNNIPLRSDENEFSDDEMIECGKCSRLSPPNRIDCIYCGESIAVDSEAVQKLRPTLRPPDEDTIGVSVVLTSIPDELDEEAIRLVRTITKLDPETLDLLEKANSFVPIAYTEVGTAPEIAGKRLRESGFAVEIVEDEMLNTDKPTIRLRGLDPDNDGNLMFIHFNNDEVDRLAPEDVELVILGQFVESNYEAHEKHKRKKGLDKVVGTTESKNSEIVIDIYTKSNPLGYRIGAGGFDFSFLGDKKGFLVGDNLEKTIDFISEWAGPGKINKDYKVLKPLLDQVWPPTATDNTKSIKRTGFGNFEKKRLISSTNEDQLIRFSRLQSRLAKEQGDQN